MCVESFSLFFSLPFSSSLPLFSPPFLLPSLYFYFSLSLSLSFQTVFLFTDGHVAQESFLELINNMLTSGMVPALFPDDEKEAVIGQVRDRGRERERGGEERDKEKENIKDNQALVLPLLLLLLIL